MGILSRLSSLFALRTCALILLIGGMGACLEKETHRQSEGKFVPEQTDTSLVPSAPDHRQALVVITPDWDNPHGILRKLIWSQGEWQQAGDDIPVLIGKKGLGWGQGLQDYTDRVGPLKQEGDLKSPAGIFTLGTAFGYAAARSASFIKMPYAHVSEHLMCIEDGASTAYNRIIDETQKVKDWTSTDHMLRKDDLYEWGLFVEHNYAPTQPGKGSCIFLHVWRKDGRGTAGCTSMDKETLRHLLGWLDPTKSPVLVQAPHSVYDQLRSELDLPPWAK